MYFIVIIYYFIIFIVIWISLMQQILPSSFSIRTSNVWHKRHSCTCNMTKVCSCFIVRTILIWREKKKMYVNMGEGGKSFESFARFIGSCRRLNSRKNLATTCVWKKIRFDKVKEWKFFDDNNVGRFHVLGYKPALCLSSRQSNK